MGAFGVNLFLIPTTWLSKLVPLETSTPWKMTIYGQEMQQRKMCWAKYRPTATIVGPATAAIGLYSAQYILPTATIDDILFRVWNRPLKDAEGEVRHVTVRGRVL